MTFFEMNKVSESNRVYHVKIAAFDLTTLDGS